MDNYDFSAREGIDAWYVGAVEQAIKQPLRAFLAMNPDAHKNLLALTYGVALMGLASVRQELYKTSRIPFHSAGISLNTILDEIRGTES